MFNKDIIPAGLGVTELPYTVCTGKQPITSAAFKNIVNKIFLPRVKPLGFKGRDFYFYRENEQYTEAVFFWTYRTGGAIQVDLLVKFNNVQYPHQKEPVKPQKIRPVKAEFQRRLSPNGERERNGQEVWFWIFEEDMESNVRIAEDIWRVFSIRGLNYFAQFKHHQQYLAQVTTANYPAFPDFTLQRVFGRHEAGIIYFLFDYWRQMKDTRRAVAFAELGIAKLKSDDDAHYTAVFKNYLDVNR
jgi:hypothetical protein